MSLTRTLLNGVSESIDITGFECGEVSIESYTLDAACEALVSGIYDIDKAYHIADIIGEVKVIKEGADPEALLEGMISSGIEKLKEMFKKFWAKIKSWFAAVRKYVKSFTLDCKNFVKEFRKELEQKKVTGFKYTAYKYTFNVDNDVNSIFANIQGRLTKCAEGIQTDSDRKRNLSDLQDRLATKQSTYDSQNTKSKKNLMKQQEDLKTGSEYEEDIIKKMNYKGATTVSELNDELTKAYRDGEEQEQEFSEFESCSVSDMLNFIESFEKEISDYEKKERVFESETNKLIKALDSVKKLDDGSNEYAYTIAHKHSLQASKLLTIGKTVCDVQISAYREAGKKYRSILGSFLRFKEAKESVSYNDRTATTESLLDVAMNLL